MLKKEKYRDQVASWPRSGQHILAQYDDQGVVVYQAYRQAIGEFAARHQYFGGEFKLSRMSWIKTNFLWMMYRCGWGAKTDQEIVLAVTIRREAFDKILSQAVHSSYSSERYSSHDTWRQRLLDSSVRLQWDPDHDPFGAKQERRAVQLGLSGEILEDYSRDAILHIEDISDFVAEGRALIDARKIDELITPAEEVYPVTDPDVARHLGVETSTPVKERSLL
jgi:hypothetical protein